MSSNEDILSYVNKYFKSSDILNTEIDEIFNNLIKYNCSIPYNFSNNSNINGIEVEYVNLINLVIFIPNLFRKCYVDDSISIPGVCPKFTFSSTVTFYYPLLIDKNLIKSFLYFNFPSNIYNYTFSDGIKNILEVQSNIGNKKINTTSGSYTTQTEIFSILYNKNSLLNQLVLFNKYINSTDFYVNNSKLINNFKVIWDFTSSCLSYTSSINDTYIIGNNSRNNIISEVTGKNLFDIKSAIYSSTPSISNSSFLKTIYIILYYAEEVYQDVLLEISYFMNSKEYCKKDYMNINNIPELISMYNIFYKNQVYSNSKDLSFSLSNDITPVVITINDYIDKFIVIYKETNNNVVLLKIVIITEKNGFVFFLDKLPAIITDYTDYYIYYYIDIYIPSPVKLTNIWKYIVNYSESGINTFISDFINGYDGYLINWVGYLKYIKASKYTFKSYPGGGLYPNLGYDYTNSNNIGYYYYFYSTSNNLISTVYLTLRTIDNTETTSAYGVALISYLNNN